AVGLRSATGRSGGVEGAGVQGVVTAVVAVVQAHRDAHGIADVRDGERVDDGRVVGVVQRAPAEVLLVAPRPGAAGLEAGGVTRDRAERLGQRPVGVRVGDRVQLGRVAG